MTPSNPAPETAMDGEAEGWTRGPWIAAAEWNSHSLQIPVADQAGDPVAAAWGGNDEAAANARLIAAAPELYEALSVMISFVSVMVGSGPNCRIPEEIATPLGVPIKIGEIVRDARAALAKATTRTGEQA